MGYNIGIGEAFIARLDDETQRIWVRTTRLDDAPNHCPFTGKGNWRSPSYSVWSEFCKDAGVYELFYGQGWSGDIGRYESCSDGFHREKPLLQQHLGAAAIGVKDADFVSGKLRDYRAAHPFALEGFWEIDPKTGAETDTGLDPVLARLVWLEFWTRWAVENCDKPTVANS